MLKITQADSLLVAKGICKGEGWQLHKLVSAVFYISFS